MSEVEEEGGYLVIVYLQQNVLIPVHLCLLKHILNGGGMGKVDLFGTPSIVTFKACIPSTSEAVTPVKIS